MTATDPTISIVPAGEAGCEDLQMVFGMALLERMVAIADRDGSPG